MNQSISGIFRATLLLCAVIFPIPSIAEQLTPSEIAIKTGSPSARVAAGRHSGKIYSITADNRDNYVITTGEDRTVRIWDIGEGRLERMIDITKTVKFNAVPYKAAFVLEREVIVVAAHSKLNVISNNPILIYNNGVMQAGKGFHTDLITTLKTFPDKQHVFSADRSGGIALWKVNIHLPTASVNLDKVFGVETPDDGMFGLAPKKAMKPYAITQADIVPIPFGVFLATLNGNGELNLFDPTKQKRFKSASITVPVGSHFDTSASSVVVMEPGGRVRLFDLELKELRLPSDLPPIGDASLSRDGRYLALRHKGTDIITLLSAIDGQFQRVTLPEQNESFVINTGFTSPDSLYVETPQGLVSWHISGEKVSKPLRFKQFPVSNVGIVADQIVFSTKGTDGERGYSFDYRTMTVKAVSPVFTTTPEPSYHDVTIVPCATKKAGFCLKQPGRDEVRAGYRYNYSAISLNRDGLLLGGAYNGTIMAESLGHVDIAEIQGAHDSAITRIAVSGDTMVTAGDDSTVKVWDIAPLRKCFSKFHETLILDTPQDGSPAAVAGLAKDDILEAVNGKQFRDQIEFLDFVKLEGKYSFSIRRKGEPLTITVNKIGPVMGLPFKMPFSVYSCKNSILPLGAVFMDDNGAWTAWKQGTVSNVIK